MAPGDAPVLLLSGGECTVTRRGDGVGGPNAEFALATTLALEGHPRIHLIACDTDGVDGTLLVFIRSSGQREDVGQPLKALSIKGEFENEAPRWFSTVIHSYSSLTFCPPSRLPSPKGQTLCDHHRVTVSHQECLTFPRGKSPSEGLSIIGAFQT